MGIIRKKFFYLFIFITATCLLAGGSISLAYTYQDKLIFLPVPRDYTAEKEILETKKHAERISIEVEPDITLDGWFLHRTTEPAPLIIYFAGNGEEISKEINAFDEKIHPNWNVLLVNYRGYGASQGKAGEEELFADSLKIYDYASKRHDVNSKRITVMGRSMGSGMSIYVASQRSVEKVILITPYDSIRSVSDDLIPIKFFESLFHYTFDVTPYAERVDVPALFIIAGRDNLIKYPRSENLSKYYAGKKTIMTIGKAFHYNINDFDQYWPLVNDFLTTD